MEFLQTHLLEICGVVFGLLYLIQELGQRRAMWITGMIMPAISLFVYYRAGLYADFAIDIYYLLAAVYGFIAWRRRGPSKEMIPVSRTPVAKLPVLAAAFVVSWALIYFVLVSFTDSNVPVADSFTTALSIVALWMLSRKWIEQWWVWAVVDAVSAALYIYKGIPFYAGLYALYTLVAVYGYFRWRKSLSPEER